MKAVDIRIELLRRGYSNRKVAKALRLADTTVSNVISGNGKSRRVAQKIASITGIPVSRLWPGSYPQLELAELRKVA